MLACMYAPNHTTHHTMVRTAMPLATSTVPGHTASTPETSESIFAENRRRSQMQKSHSRSSAPNAKPTTVPTVAHSCSSSVQR